MIKRIEALTIENKETQSVIINIVASDEELPSENIGDSFKESKDMSNQKRDDFEKYKEEYISIIK